MTIKFCIECGDKVLVDVDGGHTRVIWTGAPEMRWDVVFCNGPFEEVEPIEDPDWDLNLEEPTGDELFVMNMAADRLLLDLERE